MTTPTKHQIIFIRGGETFDTREQYYEHLRRREYNPFDHRKNWSDWVEWALSEEYETIVPQMPNKQFADYLSWRIWFEKVFPYLNEKRLVLIGSSLGGTFLVKYLSENDFPKPPHKDKPIDQLHLVAAAWESHGLGDETLGDFIFDPDKLHHIEKQAKHIHIYQSHDDPVVPFSHGRKFHEHLPKAHFHEFHDRGHFQKPAFIELLDNIHMLGK